jgi:uncharacterized protein (DUF1330 family)
MPSAGQFGFPKHREYRTGVTSARKPICVGAPLRASCTLQEDSMNRYVTPAIAMLAGAALGAAAVQGLHAQTKPPVYQVTEIDVSAANVDTYTKDYAPKAQALIKAKGGRPIAGSQNVTALEGDPPKRRVAISLWDSMESLQAYRASAEFKELRSTTGDKLAKFRSFTVEGMQ